MDETEIERLIAATALGDRLAFRRLYDRTSPHLHALCLRVLQDRAEAEEALTDAYVKIWRYAERHAASGARPLTFMLAIARHIAVERLRARRDPREAFATAEAVAAAAERTDRRPADEAGRRLADALHALGPEDARLARVAYFGGTVSAAPDGHGAGGSRAKRIVSTLAARLLP